MAYISASMVGSFVLDLQTSYQLPCIPTTTLLEADGTKTDPTPVNLQARTPSKISSVVDPVQR